MKKLWFIVIGLLLSFSVLAEKLEGKVIRVYDGDTLTLLTPEMESIKIRLAEIDSPEMKQPYGLESKIALSDLVLNKDITKAIAL